MDHKVILDKLFEHDDQFKATRQEIGEFKDEILTGLDKAMVILTRLDQERIFTNETIKRMQKQLQDQQKDIDRLKRFLKVA